MSNSIEMNEAEEIILQDSFLKSEPIVAAEKKERHVL